MVFSGVNMMELTAHGMGAKNRADIALVVDAMEIAYTRSYVDTFIILSGDSDFTPLVMRLKELNKRVIGLGTKGSTSRLIADVCDEFMFYDTLRKEGRTEHFGPESGEKGSLTRDEAFDLLLETLENLAREESGAVHASILKTSMKRKSPTFSEVELGFRTFALFLELAQEKGLVRLFRDDRAGGYRVELPLSREDRGSDRGERSGGERSGGDRGLDRGDRGSDRGDRGLDRGDRGDRGGDRSSDRGERGPDRGPDRGDRPREPREERPAPSLAPTRDGERALLNRLVELGTDIGTMADRLWVTEQFVAACQERARRGRTCAVEYLIGDLLRRVRNERTAIPARVVKGILNTLLKGGAFEGDDGDTARTPTSPFVPPDSAEALRQMLTVFGRAALAESGDVLDPAAMNDVFGSPNAASSAPATSTRLRTEVQTSAVSAEAEPAVAASSAVAGADEGTAPDAEDDGGNYEGNDGGDAAPSEGTGRRRRRRRRKPSGAAASELVASEDEASAVAVPAVAEAQTAPAAPVVRTPEARPARPTGSRKSAAERELDALFPPDPPAAPSAPAFHVAAVATPVVDAPVAEADAEPAEAAPRARRPRRPAKPKSE
jgi:hypothetical protein